MEPYLPRLKELARSSKAAHLFAFSIVIFCSLHFLPFQSVRFLFDDYDLIVNNPTIREWRYLPQVVASGRPVRGLTLMLDYHLFGLDPKGYHLMNVGWHTACCLLLYLLIHRITGRTRLATLAAVIFCVMPAHAEAVMNITHRKEMLALFFLLLAFHAWLYRGRRPIPAYLFTTVFFLLGLLSKQVALIFPALLVLHAWLEGSIKTSKRSLLGMAAFAAIAGGLLLSAVFISAPVLRDFDLFGLVKPMDLEEIGHFKILATSFSVFPLHLQHMFLPLGLSPHHLVETVDFLHPRAWLGIAVFMAMAAAVWKFRKDFLVGFSLGWIFLNLLPIMNWTPSNAFVADRYLYIPSVGAALLIATLLERLYLCSPRLMSPQGYERAGIATLSAYVFIILCSAMTNRINFLFSLSAPARMERGLALLWSALVLATVWGIIILRVEKSRWGGVIRDRVWLHLLVNYVICAATLLAMPAAMELLINHRAGIFLPNLDLAWSDIRGFLQTQGDIVRNDNSWLFLAGNSRAEILNFFVLLIGGLTLIVTLVRRIGYRLRELGDNRFLAFSIAILITGALTQSALFHSLIWSDELTLWNRAVSVEPRSAVSWNNLGKAYYGRGKYLDAARAYWKVIDLHPGRFENYRNLGIAYVKAERLGEAKQAFTRAIELNPYDAPSQMNLANLHFLEALEQPDPSAFNPAIRHYLKVLEIDPRSAHAHHNLAYCHYRMRQYGPAMDHVTKALMISPGAAKTLELRNAINQDLLESRRSRP